jgi:hypothetical protein
MLEMGPCTLQIEEHGEVDPHRLLLIYLNLGSGGSLKIIALWRRWRQSSLGAAGEVPARPTFDRLCRTHIAKAPVTLFLTTLPSY